MQKTIEGEIRIGAFHSQKHVKKSSLPQPIDTDKFSTLRNVPISSTGETA
jgi:hypothetical protein